MSKYVSRIITVARDFLTSPTSFAAKVKSLKIDKTTDSEDTVSTLSGISGHIRFRFI
jgi:CheY-specific phosphatase CheX